MSKHEKLQEAKNRDEIDTTTLKDVTEFYVRVDKLRKARFFICLLERNYKNNSYQDEYQKNQTPKKHYKSC